MARGRPPTVFARSLTHEEERELAGLIRRGRRKTPSLTWRRALIVWRSAEGATAAGIAQALGSTPDRVREVIHAFNREGMASLTPRWRGGRPRQITAAMRERIVAVATTRPQLLKEPYTRWSLRTLQAYLLRTKVVPAISTERLREILREEGVRIHRTKSWKRSPDPDFDAKAARVLELYETLPGAVVCFDELGPGPARPHPGVGVGSRGAPSAPAGQLPQTPRGAVLLRSLRRGNRSALRPVVRAQGVEGHPVVPQVGPPPVPPGGLHPLDHGQPVRPLDRGDHLLGGGGERGARAHPYLLPTRHG
jgi:transposase